MVSHKSNYRISEQLTSEGTFRDHLVQLLSSKQGQLEQVLQDIGRVLNICKGRDSTTALDNLFQSLIILTVKEVFIIFKWDFLYPLTFICSLDTSEKSQAPSSILTSIRNVQKQIKSPEPSLLKAKQSQLSQHLLIFRMLQTLNHLSGPLLDMLE